MILKKQSPNNLNPKKCHFHELIQFSKENHHNTNFSRCLLLYSDKCFIQKGMMLLRYVV